MRSSIVPLVVALSAAVTFVGGAEGPRCALADTPDAKALAQRKAREGQSLAERGQHEGALSQFKEAYELYEEPGYLYNMGIEYEALGRDVQALEAFERFLRDVQKIPPEFVADANQHQRDLRKRVGEIEIHCTPGGASLRIDDGEAVSTPVAAAIRLKSGSHRVAVSKDGFQTFVTTVAVVAASKASLDVALRPLATGARSPSAVATGEAGPVATGHPPADRREAASTAADAPLPPALSAYASAGAGFWVQGVPGRPDPTFAASFGVDGRVMTLSKAAELRLGARGGVSFVSEVGTVDTFVSLLANPKVVVAAVPGRLYLFGEVGFGLLIVSGLAPGSALLKPDATQVSGAVNAFQLRPGLGTSFAANRWLSIFAAGGFAWSPSPNAFFVESSLAQVDLALGVALGLN